MTVLGRSILTLDLGTKTGWAVYHKSMIFQHAFPDKSTKELEFLTGVKDFSTKRLEGGGMRYLRFQNWLDYIEGYFEGIDEIYFEEVRRHAGTDASHVYGGFLGTLTSWCEKNKIPYQGVPVKTIKKHITGTGNANKKMVIDAVRARGYEVEDDNEADAMALMLYLRERPSGRNEKVS